MILYPDIKYDTVYEDDQDKFICETNIRFEEEGVYYLRNIKKSYIVDLSDYHYIVDSLNNFHKQCFKANLILSSSDYGVYKDPIQSKLTYSPLNGWMTIN